MALTGAKLIQMLLHLLKAALFTLINRQVEASAVQDFHRQSDIWAHGSNKRISQSLLVLADLVHRKTFFLGENPICNSV